MSLGPVMLDVVGKELTADDIQTITTSAGRRRDFICT